VSVIRANSALLASNAAVVPPVTTIKPPSAGPAMKQIEKQALISALPSRSSPVGEVTATVAARAKERAVAATIPSNAASASTGASSKLEATHASAANNTPSTAYRSGRTRLGASWSSLATASGESSAGTACEQRKNAIAANALPVRS